MDEVKTEDENFNYEILLAMTLLLPCSFSFSIPFRKSVPSSWLLYLGNCHIELNITSKNSFYQVEYYMEERQ